jgi:hypothetical protein
MRILLCAVRQLQDKMTPRNLVITFRSERIERYSLPVGTRRENFVPLYGPRWSVLGILNSKKLCVSSILHLNDAAEYNYTLGLAQEYLDSRLRYERGPWNEFYGTALEGLGLLRKMTLFVGSFSENGDSLSQWRAYAQNGIGFSLGFEYERLQTLADAQEFRLVRCNYSKEAHEEVIHELAGDTGPQIKGAEIEDAGVAVQRFYGALVKLAAVLKHPSFAEEREWRLVSAPGSLDLRIPVMFRHGKSMIVPYREFNLVGAEGRMHVADLCVGPAPHMELAKFSVERLLSASGVEHNVMRSSVVPYRSW